MARVRQTLNHIAPVFAFALVIIAWGLAGGCAKQPPPAPTPVTLELRAAEASINEALSNLLHCSIDDRDCYVIVAERQTGKFVQFIGSSSDPLMLDLPYQTLSIDEQARAQSMLSSTNSAVESEFGFQANFERDAASATAIALRVLREVYQFGDQAELQVTLR